jgi:glyoxylase-like metal-dependent hydrolase (beta-lactamase superfamily II)
MARAGALHVKGLDGVQDLAPGMRLDVPGTPTVLFVPGHTAGHVALHLPERDVVLTGDALVTLDPYTGRRGPRIVAGAATADSAENLRSLDVLATTGASIVLPGHGEPWRGGIVEAAELARRAGAA